MKQHQKIYLKNYKVPEFLVNEAELAFNLEAQETIVVSTLQIVRNGKHKKPLILDGHELVLLEILLNDMPLAAKAYQIKDGKLIIPNVPNKFYLSTTVAINPQSNKALEGLYISNNIFCTQCEAHAFSKITYCIDRPDVMTKFTTTITADKSKYPVLLSNGNLIESGKLSNNRHFVTWQDPSLKPCYLFALVAGDLLHIADKFVTKSKKKIDLAIYFEKGQQNKSDFAMQSLKKAMRWDEEVFGCEYDLDNYMIVAINDFNFGAMENKGLNIFNAKYVLADSKTATDDDYLYIENVVAHEYFHNWTGNRITCRDWFQLSLKEGLTMFRDQTFSADMTSQAIARIKDVNVLRSMQFIEDAGPLAHPVQPKSYMEINNLYTYTIYHKGAELIHMLRKILGDKAFYRAVRSYIKKYDGKAATIENFLQVLAKVGKINLQQFAKWYHEKGTPILDVESFYDKKQQTLTLTVTQDRDFYIPLEIGFLAKTGKEMPLKPAFKTDNKNLLTITRKKQQFKFMDVSERPVLSLLRNFSAPVKVNYSYTDEELLCIIKHDSDAFCRFDAWQTLATRLIKKLCKNRKEVIGQEIFDALWFIITSKNIANDLKALLLMLPNYSYLTTVITPIDVDGICFARERLNDLIAENLENEFFVTYKKLAVKKAYTTDYVSMARRSLRNLCLSYLVRLQRKNYTKLAVTQFNSADNMTDVLASLRAVNDFNIPERALLFDKFYQRWHKEDLVINKWLELQASTNLPNALALIKKLQQSKVFRIDNPNKVYALLRTFAQSNLPRFHAKNGAGYEFLAEQIIKIDKINPHLSANLIVYLANWQAFPELRRSLMRKQLQRISRAKLSKNLFELVEKSLN
jgi:aminopeptidase N